MRTTLNLDPEILQAAKGLAESENKTIGQVVSALAWKGLRSQRVPHSNLDGFPVFSVSPQAKPLTPEMVRQAVDDETGNQS